jgi:hypothetical protein
MQTIMQRKLHIVDNYFLLVLTNIHVSATFGIDLISSIIYLTYDYINKKVYNTDTKNLVSHITGVDFNALYPSAYGSVPNEMIGYTGNKMLIPGNFKENTIDKQKMLDVINEKKELFVVTLKGGIPEVRWNEFINYAPIIRNIEI